MPTYEYECKKCGIFEVEQKISDNKLESCLTCKEPVARLISQSTSFVLKGDRWYKDGYK